MSIPPIEISSSNVLHFCGRRFALVNPDIPINFLIFTIKWYLFNADSYECVCDEQSVKWVITRDQLNDLLNDPSKGKLLES